MTLVSRYRLLPLAGLVLLVGCGAPESGPASGAQGTQQTDDVTSTPSLKANVPGFTVWVDQPMKADERYGGDVFVVRGRTSKNLSNAFSFASDDEFGEALVVSPRVFEFTVDKTSAEMLLSGTRLFITLNVVGETDPYYVGLLFSSTLGGSTGSAKFNVHAPITPVLVDGGLRFRGVTSVVNGVSGVAVAGPLAPADALRAISARTYSFDFLADAFTSAAHAAPPVVRFTATAGGVTVERDATIELEASSLGLAKGGSPYDAFPEPACDASVEACLEALPQGEGDTGACGTSKQVQTCWSTRGSPQRMATDLRNALPVWYQQHVAANGGNTLEQAMAAVDEADVVGVTDPGLDPAGHDLTKYRVLSHPDVVYPGSSDAWFGAYARSDGALDEIYDDAAD
jgi:hypothetical protein